MQNKNISFLYGITPIYKAGLFVSILYLCFFLLLFLARLQESFITVGNLALVFLGLISHVYLYNKLKKNRLYMKFIKTYIVFMFIMCINFIIVHNFEIKALLHGIITLPALALIIYFYDFKPLISLTPFVIVLFMIIFKWFILGLGPEEVTINSRNYIVFYLFIFSLPYFLHCYRINKLPTLLLPLIFLVIAILVIGRGSIIMAVVCLIGWLFMLLKTTEHKFLIWGIVILLIYYTVKVSFFSDNFELLFSRFEEKGLESTSRADAWAQYIDYSFRNIINLFCGTNKHSVPLVRELDDSLHNSYLTAHAYLGLFFIPYLYKAFRGFFVFFKQKHFFMLGFFGALLIKACVDADFPCTAVGGDIYMCILILIGINDKYSNIK